MPPFPDPADPAAVDPVADDAVADDAVADDAALVEESRAALRRAAETALIASDGRPLFARRYDPPEGTRLRGTVVLRHGIQSHSGWYGWGCAAWAAAGWRVIAADRRGAGRNGAGRGDARHADRLLADVRHAVRSARRLAPRRPVVLAGVSWGAKTATIAAAGPGLCDGLVLLNPGLRTRVRLGAARAALVRAAVAAGRGRAVVRVPLDDPALFAATAGFREFIAHDPLAVRAVSLRFLAATADLDRRVPAAVRRLRVPVLAVLAGADGIVDNPATRRLLGTCGADEVTVRVVPAARHTLEFEPDRAAWHAGVTDWLAGIS